MTCPDCEYHKNRAARWRAEAYKLTGHEVELPWVGLTTEDMATCIDEPAWDLILRKAEQILKEKNT
jgi:hypothetical protein